MSADGRYRFYIDEPIDEPDFWVVNGKGVRQPESCMVAPQNTIMLATEPKSVLVYPQKYLRQFGLVCTCQENTNHPNVHYGPADDWHNLFNYTISRNYYKIKQKLTGLKL